MKIRLTLTSLSVTMLFVFTAARTQAHPASGIVVDRTGNIYFSDLETVWKLDTQAQLTVFRQGMRGRHVHELSVDEKDNIYGADVSYNPSTKGWISDVWKMTPEGTFAYLLEPTEHPPRGWSIWPDRTGNMYLVDQNNHTKRETLLLRRTPDGRVTTLARDLTGTTSEDQPRLFGGSHGSLASLTVDTGGNVYVADTGNRRLLKINTDGAVEVMLRSEPPYFPTGVAAASGNLYVLEVGFTLPNAWSGPRIRKIDAEGKPAILTTLGTSGGLRSRIVTQAGVTAESTLAFFHNDGRIKYTLALLLIGTLSILAVIWRHRRRARA